jgi:hypothetical protein
VPPEVVVTESKPTAAFTAAETTIMESAGHGATVEVAHCEATAVEAATAEATAVETAAAKATAMATTKAAATAAVATTTTATATATAAPPTTPTRQRHCRRSQSNGRNRQQRNNCFAHHNHTPFSDTRSQPQHSVQVAIVWENRYLLRRVRYSTLRERLNSNSGIKLSAWRAAALPRRVRCYRRNRIWNLVTKAA